MGRKPKKYPAMTRHKARGLAKVTLNGVTKYLGPWGSPEAQERYDDLLRRWIAAGRDMTKISGRLTVSEMCARYREHATEYYRSPTGEPTAELRSTKESLRHLWKGFGSTPAEEFGPVRLQNLRDQMIKEKLSRTTINNRIGRVKRVFRWAEANELVPRGIWESLRSVQGLARGRSAAPDQDPVEPVEWQVVKETLPFLPETHQAMAMVQWWTALRPGEVVRIYMKELDMSGPVWLWQPALHKTSWRGRKKVVAIGPKAQDIMRPFLSADPEACVFPSSKTGKPYLETSYCRAVARAVQKATAELRRSTGDEKRFVPHWSPNQLRHARLTTVRQEFGLEASQNVGGHANADVTQIYAERDLKTAMRVAEESG